MTKGFSRNNDAIPRQGVGQKVVVQRLNLSYVYGLDAKFIGMGQDVLVTGE